MGDVGDFETFGCDVYTSDYARVQDMLMLRVRGPVIQLVPNLKHS